MRWSGRGGPDARIKPLQQYRQPLLYTCTLSSLSNDFFRSECVALLALAAAAHASSVDLGVLRCDATARAGLRA